MTDNRMREVRQSFESEPLWPSAPSTRAASNNRPMRVKIFKSGNSLALRLPASLGLEAGMEMELTVQPDGGYSLHPLAAKKKKFNVDAIWGIGAHLDLQPIKSEDRVFEPSKRPWDDPDWPGWGDGEA